MTHFAGKAAKVLFLTGTMTLLLTAHTMAADIAIGAGCTTGSSLRMRAETSTSSEIITTLDKSVAVAILDDTTEGWYQVAYNGKTGYVSADYLLMDQDNVFETYGRVNGDGVNVRSGASTEAEVLAQCAEKNLMLTVTALNDRAVDIRGADFRNAVAVIGSEGQGVRQSLLEAAAQSVIIPMQAHCESLNAAIAAAIVMWQMKNGEYGG